MTAIQPRPKNITLTIITIALPITLQNMAFYLQSFINTAFIGHYRVEGLAAINNAMIPFFMLFSFFVALSQGTTVLIAQSLGANDPQKAGRVAECSLFYNQLMSFGYLLFWYGAGPVVLSVMGARGAVLAMGGSYIQVMSFVYVTLGCSITAAAIFQGVGTTLPIMITTLIRVGCNILFDYLFIFGKLGFPEFGVTGAAVATVISTTLSNIMLLIWVMRSGVLPVRWYGVLRPVKGIYPKVFAFGAQTGGEFLLWTGAQVVMVRMLNHFNELGAGMYGILNTMLGLSVNLYWGIGVAATTLVGRATGATDYREAFRTGNICALYSILLCCMVGMVYLFLPGRLLSIFTADRGFTATLLPLLPVVALVSFPKAINVVIGNAIRGTGDVRWMLFTQSAGTIIIIVFSSWLLFGRHLGVAALVWANFGDEGWRAVVNYSRFYIKGINKINTTAVTD